MNCTKLYMITITQGTLTFKRTIASQQDVLNQLSYFFGLLIIGNTIDNLDNIKPMLIVSEILTAFGWVMTAILAQLYESHEHNPVQVKSIQVAFLYVFDFCSLTAATIILVNIL